MPARTFEDHKMDPNFGEKVVISGMSGLYPGCLSVKELSHVLYNQVDPMTSNDSRWECSHPDLVQRSGAIPKSELETFDAQFFKVHFRLGQCMDVLSRKLLEQAYQAIYDAGIAPAQLDGKKIAVYIGFGISEAELSSFYEASDKKGFNLLGGSKCMIANRISYWINSKGPSATINQACCGSIAALEKGIKSIESGECEAAIVGGTHLCLHTQNLIHYRRMGCLSLDGKTRSFDKNATGFAGSEAINILFLQKAKDAKRCYAEVIRAQTKFTALEQYPMGTKHAYYRNPKNTVKFLEEFYDEANVSPQDVKYVEAFGSGIPEVDKSELDAFDEVFCSERKEPLLVGSIMSNIGYTENACGISAITKVLLGYQTGQLAANLHFKSPREDVTSIRDGRLCIVTENKPFENSSYAAVNTLSFNGINGHVLLRGYYKPKNLSRYASNIPRLVLISGRQESAVEKILEDLKSRPLDLEEIALLHNAHESREPGHLGRGFTILDVNESNETMSLAEKASYFDAATSPLWFVYSGMGSQWPGMGKQLLQIPTFAAAIDKCCAVLKEKKIDLLNIITSTDPKIFDNILNSFVGIAAIQIGLTDVLTELGIVPNCIIGHSVGELGCAYADGCLTAEEMILCAYSRGLVSIQNPLIFGSMAAVGLGFKEVQKLLPNEIEIACHNSSTSCTISGPADAVKSFVTNLRSQTIFAKEVPCSNIAYHSRYIANLGPDLLRHLNEIIKTPTLRSKRWLSTSVSEKLWDKPSAMYNSAEYHTNNLLNPVLFEETAKLIPPNAVIIEVAPYGLLQAILKRSLPLTKKITITQRGSLDAVKYFLEAIGELYIAGYDPIVKNLYPKIEFPVSTGTPMLSHLVDWAHNEKWKVPSNFLTQKKFASSCEFLISLHDEENKYLRGHQMKDKNVYPFAAALVLVWDTLAMVMGVMKKELSVQFNDVNFYSQPMLSEKRNMHLTVSLHRGSGHFEVRDRKAKIITGFIKIIEKNAQKYNFNNINDNKGRIYCSDIYNLLSLKGFNYYDDFQSIQSANMLLTNCQISWRNNWVTLIDGLLQLNFLRNTHDSLSKLKFIKRIDIDITKHVSEVISLEDDTKVIDAHVNDIGTRCGGIYLNGIELQDIAIKCKDVGMMKVLKFVPHFSKSTFNEETILNIYTQIVSENLNKNTINILRITKNNSKATENGEIRIISETKIKITTTLRNNIIDSISLKDVDLVVIENLSTDDEMCQTLQRALSPNSFIINKEYTNKKSRPWPFPLYSLVCGHHTHSSRMELIYKRSLASTAVTNALSVFSPSDLSLFLKIVSKLSPQQNLIVFSSYPPLPKLKDTIRKYRQESNMNISLIMVNNNKSLDQYLDVDRPDLAYNVVYDNVVGGEYYLPIQDVFGEEMMLECKRIGDINSLHWTEIPEPAETGVIVKVLYAGLSTVDAKTIAGVITSKTVQQNPYGMEFSGYVERIGTRVMGLVNDGSVKTQIRANPHLLWPVPKHWSLEDAATVPLAYSLAFYCLVIKSRIRHHMKIFVHGGTGALGQAIISIALAFDCEVFTSVSSISKKQFLLRLFPELKGDHICYSRNESFGEVIQKLTKGKGCDIVICTVKAGLKNISLECCGASGITIDTSLLQDQEDYSIGMGFMWHSRSYTTVNLSTIFTTEYQDNLQMLQSLISEGIARGYVRPLTRVTYSANDVTNAVRLLVSSRHRGRVILDLQTVVPLTTFPRLKCSPNLGHVIISDNDSLGILFVEKLISRGVKKLHLQWRTPSKLLEFKSRHWQNQGVKIYISYNDIIDGADVLLHISKEIKPIQGLYLLSNKEFSNKLENSLKHLLYSSDSYNGLLKYSTIINVDNSTEDNSLDLLYENEMVIINLPKVKEFAQYKSALHRDCISVHDTVEAIEYALATKERASSLRWSAKPMTILEYIVSVAGKDINLTDNTRSTMTLQDLGLEISQAEIIQVFLSDVYNISYCIDDVLHLSIKDIKEIDEEMSIESYKDKDKRGLWAFISNLDPDEIETSSNFVIMPTLTNNSGMICTGDLSVKQKYMFVIPGLEDSHTRFEGICERLKMAALVFHLGCEIPNETIPAIAERLVQIMPLGNKDKRFYLLGYEYGVLVALEMAAILEDQGFSGLVFCIGGGPEDVLATFNEQLGDLDTNEALQVAVLKHLFTLMVGECTTDVEAILKKVSTWEERVIQSVRLLRGRTVYSSLYIQQLIDTTYNRLIHLRQYKYTPRALRSQIISLRSGLTLTDQHTSSLQRHSQKPVVEYTLQKALANITDDLRCPSLINQHLDKDILDTFDTSNLCDNYFIGTLF